MEAQAVETVATPTEAEWNEWRNSNAGKWFFQWLQLRYQSHAVALIQVTGAPGQKSDETVIQSVNNASACRQLAGTKDAQREEIEQDTYLFIHGSLEGSRWEQKVEANDE